MPIQINLKEVFASDPLEINVDKINFNFNKLLELGVGQPGPQGPQGPQGPAGPVGPIGPDGTRGSIWNVGTGDPNNISFPSLLGGDMFLDANDGSMWYYDDTTSMWVKQVDLVSIISNYLYGNVTFERDILGDSRYINFIGTGDNLNDTTLGNTSSNDILHLSNINDSDYSSVASPNDLYNSLLQTYVDHSITSIGRYHFELGSLYVDDRINPSVNKFTENKHNFKIRFVKDNISGTATYANTNHFINVTRFLLSKPEVGPLGDIDENSMLEIVTPIYNNEGSTPFRDELTVRIGSQEALDEYSSAFTKTGDGIEISRGPLGAFLGLNDSIEDVIAAADISGPYALLNASDATNGLALFNNVKHFGGTYDIRAEKDPVIVDEEAPITTDVNGGHYMNQDIFISGNTLWAVSGDGDNNSTASRGHLIKADVSNPDDIQIVKTITTDKTITFTPFSPDQHNHGYGSKRYMGHVKSICEYGKYIVIVQQEGNLSDMSNNDVTLQVFETDSMLDDINIISNITATNAPVLKDAYKVRVNGNHAWVITNQTRTTGPYSFSLDPVVGRLIAVDLSNPDNNIPLSVSDYYTDENGSKYLDFELHDKKAIVLKHVDDSTNGASLKLVLFDIHDPSTFGTNPLYLLGEIVLNGSITSGTKPFGSVTANNRYACASYENNIYVVEMDGVFQLINTINVDPTVTINDIILEDRYLYVLCNSNLSLTGFVKIYDISDPLNPVLVVDKEDAAYNDCSRMEKKGKNIYVVKADVANTQVKLMAIETPGLIAPGANIGNIRTSHLDVTGSARIKDNLTIKNSLNVGPGGVYIDEGNGLHVDGVIKGTIIDLSDITEENTLSNLYAIGVDITTGELRTTSVLLNDTSISDIKFKHNIKDYKPSDDDNPILKLNPVTYEWKTPEIHLNKGTNIGFIAQDVQEVLPEAVYENGGVLGIDQMAIIAALVDKVKSQDAIIKRLEERLNEIEDKLN